MHLSKTFTPFTVHSQLESLCTFFELDRKHLVVPVQNLSSYQLAPSSPLWQQLAIIVTWSLLYINLHALHIYWTRLRRRLLNDTSSKTTFHLLCIPFTRVTLPTILPPQWNTVPLCFHVSWRDWWNTNSAKTSQSHRTCKTAAALSWCLYKWQHYCHSLKRCPFCWQCSTICHVGWLNWLLSTRPSFNTLTVIS
jgi:hypothetical protein